MKTAFTSDIHWDITLQNRRLPGYLAAELERLRPDVFVIAGDVANTLNGWEEALRPFMPLPCRKLVVPGNHDIWLESKRPLRRSEDNWWKYTQALCICAHRHHQVFDDSIDGVRVVRSPVGYLQGFEGDYAEKARQVITEIAF